MKRFSIFCAALFAAATSFATVAYELNGGVQSTYLTPQDMYADLNVDYNAATGATATWVSLAECTATNQGIPTAVATIDITFFTTGAGVEKWGWLATYVDKVSTEQGVAVATAASANLRYNLQSFFKDWQHTGWPKSADYTTCGVSSVAAYQPYWKSAFANPTAPETEWVLNTPYKEGATFDGWYATADFSGAKVTTINAETTGTLYAKWIEYIPTTTEVKALADDTETKVSGVVNFITGKNVYIQDAQGGILVYTSETPSCKVGDKIVVKGVKVMYGGAPEVKNAVIESAEVGELATPVAFETLAPLVNDTVLKYFATNVTVPGLVIAEYDSYNNPTVQDAAGNKALCYKMVLDPAAYPVGCKVTVTAVAAWYNGFQFVGDAKNIVRPLAGKKENYTYEERSNGRFKLDNNWVISEVEGNYSANKPGSTDYVRGMAAKDGIMYFINRETESIVRVDGTTGDMLDPIKLKGEHLFEKASVDETTGDTTWAAATTLPFNDIKFDWAGNCLIGACIGGATACQPFFIYMVNLETGECTKIIEDVLWDNPGLDQVQFRFDAFGCAGDVTKNGVVMAATNETGGLEVYRWLITDGVADEGKQVKFEFNVAVDQSLYIDKANFGTAPQIFPQDELGELYYVDGFHQLPMLFYHNGNPEEKAQLIDDFIYVPTGTKVWNTANEVCSMNTGHNGLVEFQVGEEYFLLMAATNTAGSPTSAFALYRFADEDRAFEGMEPLWYFPHNGLGSKTNGCRTAVPSVDVISDKQAVLYIYSNNNGYASYTLDIDTNIDYEYSVPSSVEEVGTVQVGVSKVLENAQVYIIKNGVKYNILGAAVK